MKITTKTGDKGETSLFGGRRVSKASRYIELVGELDELQSVIGWASIECSMGHMGDMLKRVQDDIYRMMSVVGFEMKCPGNIKAIDVEDVTFLEGEIEARQDVVEGIKAFIRPGGSEAAARLHMARTVCRRVERRMVAAEVEGEMLKYLNRLSDLLFILAYSC